MLLFGNLKSLMYSVIMVAMIIAIAVGAGACPMNLTLVFLLFILSIHIIAGLGTDSFETGLGDYGDIGDVLWLVYGGSFRILMTESLCKTYTVSDFFLMFVTFNVQNRSLTSQIGHQDLKIVTKSQKSVTNKKFMLLFVSG